MATFEIRWDEVAVEELTVLRAFDQERILDETDEQLSEQPNVVTKRRKLLEVEPPWEQEGPVWQLRVGDFRVFYDIDEPNKVVIVRAVREKGNLTTEEIL